MKTAVYTILTIGGVWLAYCFAFLLWDWWKLYRAANYFTRVRKGLFLPLVLFAAPVLGPTPAHALTCADLRKAVLTLTPEEVAAILRAAALPEVSQAIVCLRAELQRGGAK